MNLQMIFLSRCTIIRQIIKDSLIISVLLALGGGATYFISGRALKPIGEFSDKIEEVQLQNLSVSDRKPG